MKRALLLLAALASAGLAHAGPFEWAARQDAATAVFAWTDVAASSSAIIVDLSDTSGFPHKLTGQVNVAGIRVDIGKVAASSGTIKVGVVTRVDATNGDVKWFFNHTFGDDATGSPTHYSEASNFSEVSVRAKVKDGTTPYLASKLTTANSTTFQTDVNLPTTIGNGPPGVGDIVVQYTTAGTSATDISLELVYFTEKP